MLYILVFLITICISPENNKKVITHFSLRLLQVLMFYYTCQQDAEIHALQVTKIM